MMNNNEQVCNLCGNSERNHSFRHVFTPKPTPDPKVEQCEYCGPICYKGAAHNAKVEDNAEYTDEPSDYGKKMTITEVERHLLNIKVEQVAQRPKAHRYGENGGTWWFYGKPEADALFDSQDAKIASLELSNFALTKEVAGFKQVIVEQEKELRVTRRALEMAARDLDTINRSHGMMPIVPEMYLEAAIKGRS